MSGNVRAVNAALTVIRIRIRLYGLEYGPGYLDADPQVLVVDLRKTTRNPTGDQLPSHRLRRPYQSGYVAARRPSND